MPGLMIGIVNGQWTAEIENVPGVSYAFFGGDLATQAQFVQAFANEMVADDPIAALMSLDLGADAPAVVAQDLFGTESLYLDGEWIMSAGEDDILLDALEAAGEALLEALAL